MNPASVLLFDMTRRSTLASLAVPILPIALVLFSRSMRPHSRLFLLEAGLLGVMILCSTVAGIAGLRAMEILQPRSARAWLKVVAGLNGVIGTCTVLDAINRALA